jgi:hypothetical protein
VKIGRGTRWLRAALVAPVLVFALGASSHLAVRCTLTGILMPESCCPDAADVADLAPPAPAPQPSVGDPGCCEQVTIATARIPAAGVESRGARPAQTPISVAAPLASIVVDRTATPPGVVRRAARPPGASLPLYVVTHAFLI